MRKGISNQRAIGLHDTRHNNFTTNARSCPSPFAHEIDTSKKRYLDTVVDQKPQKLLCKRTTQPDHHRNARQNAVLTIFSISRKCSYRNHAKKWTPPRMKDEPLQRRHKKRSVICTDPIMRTYAAGEKRMKRGPQEDGPRSEEATNNADQMRTMKNCMKKWNSR